MEPSYLRGEWSDDTEWEPLPAPSSEYVTQPEPECVSKIAEYIATHDSWSEFTTTQAAREAVKVIIGDEAALREVIAAARPDWMDALNRLDRDGIVLGAPRPMADLPDEHEFPALIIYGDDGKYNIGKFQVRTFTIRQLFRDRTSGDDLSDQLPYGDWRPGRWAWRLEDVRRLTEPVTEYPSACECPNPDALPHLQDGTVTWTQHPENAEQEDPCINPNDCCGGYCQEGDR